MCLLKQLFWLYVLLRCSLLIFYWGNVLSALLSWWSGSLTKYFLIVGTELLLHSWHKWMITVAVELLVGVLNKIVGSIAWLSIFAIDLLQMLSRLGLKLNLAFEETSWRWWWETFIIYMGVAIVKSGYLLVKLVCCVILFIMNSILLWFMRMLSFLCLEGLWVVDFSFWLSQVLNWCQFLVVLNFYSTLETRIIWSVYILKRIISLCRTTWSSFSSLSISFIWVIQVFFFLQFFLWAF